jgi:hypothetical protein
MSLIAVEFAVPAPSEAQGDADVAAARAAFREGIEAASAERWPEARDRFRRAYELSPRPRILVNLGSAYRQTGELLEAREAYQRFLVDAEDRDLRRTVEAELAEVINLIPQLTIRVENLQDGDRVLLDGEEVDRLGSAFETNPGMRSVEVQRTGRTVAQVRVNVEPQGTEEVQLRAPDPLDPREVAIGAGTGSEEEEETGGGNTGLVVGLVVAAVAVVAAVIAIVFVAGRAPDAFQGNYPGGMSVPVP